MPGIAIFLRSSQPRRGLRRLFLRCEAGMPYCFTIDGQTLEDQTVTVRERDTLSQELINID